jgi:hypothetical protein
MHGRGVRLRIQYENGPVETLGAQDLSSLVAQTPNVDRKIDYLAQL